MNKKAKFWLFFLLGICIFTPFFLLYIIVQMFLHAIWVSGVFLTYCYFLYRFVYKGEKPEYPMVPPEGRMDIYSLEPIFQDPSMKTCNDIPNSSSEKRKNMKGQEE